ncbi:MAG: c-type cytochrome biogenesis protein CcsB [Geodermatophilaceae bacterium]|nr:c-type cytochrome biogenesis protein CcsB [Geodermatophilaceae bacterium]
MAVNDTLAAWSDTAFTASIVVYSVAIVGYAGEYAFGRQGRVARTSAAQTGPAPVGTIEGPPNRQHMATRLGRVGLAGTALGALMQLLSLTLRGIAAGRAPWANMFEFASAVALVAVVAFLWVQYSAPKLRHLGLFVLVPVVFVLVYAGLELYTEAAPLIAALRSYWLVIHVAAAIISVGVLFTSGVLAALYLVRQRYERGLIEDAPAPKAIVALGPRLPDATVLDRLSYRLVAFAFPIFTFMVIAGAIWAESAWGRFWGWDPKETWALIVWLVYAGYLHARATAGWKGTKAARINLLGFFAITFNFLVINLVVAGLHSYSGLT